VPGEQRPVRQRHVITHAGVVSHVAMRHQEIGGADDRRFRHVVGAMDGDVFPKEVVIADAQFRRFTVELAVLRRVTDDAAGVKLIACANRRVPGEVNVRSNTAVGADGHKFVDDDERPDCHARVEPCAGVNDRGGMYHASAKIA